MMTPEKIAHRLKWLLGHVEQHLLTLSVALQVVYKVRVVLCLAVLSDPLSTAKDGSSKPDEDGLKQALADYEAWMTSGCAAKPSFAVRLFWLTHMLHPRSYAEDCKRLCGQVIGRSPATGRPVFRSKFARVETKQDAKAAAQPFCSMDLVAGVVRQTEFARKALRSKHMFLIPELAQAVSYLLVLRALRA